MTYTTLREKIAAEKIARAERYNEFAELWKRAYTAGIESGHAYNPRAMIVRESGENGRQWLCPEGLCGFAWITIRPANCSFARYLKANNIGRKAYNGGWQIWISEFNQSMERKSVCASTIAQILNNAGINAYPGFRAD